VVTVTAEPGALTVADTGPGLAPEHLPHVFERFFLYSRYGTNRAVGTGLGLAIVKELTEAMEGSITVQSAPGGGTRFVVRLPAAPATPEA
jgi:two-component system sensor histidine kinase BaeS